jgi:transcriptional regulator GlxA family with amidase domain
MPLASRISRRMVAPLHRTGGQAQFMRRPLPDGDRNLQATCDWALGELHRPLTITELAAHARLSTRSLTKRFVEETGMAPMEWLTSQRVLEARRLLEATELPVEEIAQRSGLGTAGNLRLHLARETSVTPAEYRRTRRESDQALEADS